MIVNDLKNRKTIDTETDVFLTKEDERGRECLQMFLLVEGDLRIDLTVEVEYERLASGQVAVRRRAVSSDFLKSNPDQVERYSELFQRFLSVYGFAYGQRTDEISESTVDFRYLNKGIHRWL